MNHPPEPIKDESAATSAVSGAVPGAVAAPDSLPQPAGPASPADPKPKPSLWRRGRGLLPSLLVLPVTAGALGCLLGWGLATQSGSAWLLNQVPGLQVTQPEGSLLGDFSAQRLSYAIPGTEDRVEIDELRWRGLSLHWNRSPHLWGDLHIDSLQAKQVQLHLKPSAEPSTAPSSLSLPIGIEVARLQVSTLLLPDSSDKPFNDVQGSLSLSAQGGAEHQLKLDHLRWDLLQLSGSARVQTEGALGLQAELALRSKANAQEQLPAWQAQLQAKGPLHSLAMSAHLQAESQDLQAQAQVHPFAAWPLPQLKVNTQGLDLAALVSGLPHTRLSGQAEWQTQPAGTTGSAALPSLVLKSQLSNSLAGRWNEQRLPARALNLDLSFAPGDPAALSIKQLELLLGSSQQPAGQVHASGQSSKDKGSALTIAISELNSQALDARAAAMQVAGEIELRTAQPVNALAQAGDSLPQLSIEAKLEGRLLSPDTRGRKPPPAPNAVTSALGVTPISLQTQAQVSATALTLQSFKLRFDEASLDASGHMALQAAASLAKGWQATAQAQAQVPDLRRLWRGEEGSRWRQSAQPMLAQFDAKLQAGPLPSGNRGQAATLKAYAPTGTARMQLQPTVLAGVPLSADLQYSHLDLAQTPQFTAFLNAGANNRLQVQGELKASGELHSDATLQFAELSSLQPLLTAFRAPAAKATAKTGTSPLPLRADLQGSLQGKLQLIAAVGPMSSGRPDKPGSTANRWTWRSKSELQARALQVTGLPDFATLRLAAADLQWAIDSSHQAPLDLRAKLEQLSLDGINLPSASATVQGTWAQHRVELQAMADGKMPAALIAPGEASDQRLRGPVTLSLNAGLSKPPTQAWLEGAEWQARELMFLAQPQGQAAAPAPAPPLLASAKPTAGKAAAPSSAWLKAQNLRMDLAWSPELQLKQLQVAPGRLELLGAGLSWQELQWQAAEANPSVGPAPNSVGRFNLDLRLEPLAVAPLLARWQPEFGWSGDLVLAGHARVRSAPGLHVDIAVERSSGDLIVSDDNGVQKLDLSELRFGLVGSPGLWHLTQALAGRNVGVLGGAVTARNENPHQIWPNKESKLEGVLEARVANLSTWGAWVPAGWRTGGSVFASASFSGQVKAPEIKGRAGGSGLVLRNPLLGVDLQRGEFALSLDGGQAKLEQFKAYAGDGDLSARGEIQFGAKPRVDLHLQADKFGVLRRVDQRLAVNGRVDIALDADLVDVQGQLDVHEGLFDFSRGNAPELGDDVTVRRPEAASAEADHKAAAAGKRRAKVKVKVDIDLGKKLRVKGYGLDTLLAGNLQLTQAANGPALHGRISTESGTFDAYGQKLVIEKGNISFSGVMDNPRLDVLALRPSQEDQRVGVTITGTAQKPRVKLYSEPALDERSTLSWLLLGRAPSELGTQDSALLSSAALALLNGQGESKTSKLIKSVGLDELSFSDSGVEAQGTVVRLGKQLSKRWYVGYERGLNATTGSWQLVYRLAQRFTLRAQSGDDNALDLIWQWKWE